MCDNTMGVITSRILSPSAAEPQFEGDEVTGLSGNDKRIIARTFNIVAKDVAKNGERLFIIFFTKYPEHMQFFRDFKDKPLEELEGTPKLIAHGTNVLCTFNSIVLSLDKPGVLVELLLKIGYSHGRHRVHTPALRDLKVAIVALFSEVLKDAMTEQVADVWSRALDVILNTVEQGIIAFNKEH